MKQDVNSTSWIMIPLLQNDFLKFMAADLENIA